MKHNEVNSQYSKHLFTTTTKEEPIGKNKKKNKLSFSILHYTDQLPIHLGLVRMHC